MRGQILLATSAYTKGNHVSYFFPLAKRFLPKVRVPPLNTPLVQIPDFIFNRLPTYSTSIYHTYSIQPHSLQIFDIHNNLQMLLNCHYTIHIHC